ncbi:MAG: cobyrinate a,c-diamide synthase [Polyangiaceae bacterium]|nr:cobyrinate a,c-diamide synthase [Polyangiaceae bacterium]
MGSHARLVIAGLSGDSGKTLVSLGLVAAWRRAGLAVAAFKKGPDYIDASWLGWAAGVAARNLDVHLMGEDVVRCAFARHARQADIAVIEGNRGLFDGVDASGSASTARLAALLEAPVVLVVPATKMTATAAALVRGCQVFDPRLRLGGVVLNRVASSRQARVTRAAIEAACGIPVLGILPRFDDELLPSRHLGLVTPAEHGACTDLGARLAEVADAHLDLSELRALAGTARPLDECPEQTQVPSEPVVVGYFRDSAFTFYYPENLEALEREGAILKPLSALEMSELPDLDLLYIGGGFPETHAAELSANQSLRDAVRDAASRGLPIYAECGGLVYLAEVLRVGGSEYPMSGVLPIHVGLSPRPQGHGYCDVETDAANPFFPVGMTLRGHEFHYTRITRGLERLTSAYSVTRGFGCGAGRDGLVVGNVLASYIHLHASGVPAWARHLCCRASRYRRTKRDSDASSEKGRQEGSQEDGGWRRCGGGRRRDVSASTPVPA